MKVLVTGGAGYIGSITVRRLNQRGIDTVVLDNLKYGHKESVNCPIIIEDLLNKDKVLRALKNYKFEAVIHFASYALPGESMTNPYKYFSSNIQGGLNLLEIMKEMKIQNIIYSSSCAIYGTLKKLPAIETGPKNPESVYGESKSIFETMISWYAKLYGIKYINLRYFNAAGASIEGDLGEDHEPETHLIPNAIKCLLQGNKFTIFGNNYDTPDGTCIRDYIHVEDLAIAHITALDAILNRKKIGAYNIGSGVGYSNLEITKMIEKVSGRKLNVQYGKRRAGDPPIVCANVKKAKRELNFSPKYSDLETIIKSAYNWHLKHNASNHR